MGYFNVNLAIWWVITTIVGYINIFLGEGFDLNAIIRDVLGIDFFYLKHMALVEGTELIFARITPGFNISWANAPVTLLG